MKAATIIQIKKELKTLSHEELMDYCLRMAKFSKDSKELLTYLLFESQDEFEFVKSTKQFISGEFCMVNSSSYYLSKKTIRKILRHLNKLIRYSGKKETKVELLLHFCTEMLELRPSVMNYYMLANLYDRQKAAIVKAISTLHEDLQYDYQLELEELEALE